MRTAYLDIETCYRGTLGAPYLCRDYPHHTITVIGIRTFDGTLDRFIQLVARVKGAAVQLKDVSRQNLLEALKGADRVVTYNGRSIPDDMKRHVGFDFPVIAVQLGFVVDKEFEHTDLVPLCWRKGLYGGQKKVEETLGLWRELPGKDGAWASEAWKRYEASKDKRLLDELLAYNKEDVFMLRQIELALRH